MMAHAEVGQWDSQCPADMVHKSITVSNLGGTNTLTGYKQMYPLVICPETMHAAKRTFIMIQ